MKKVLFIMIGIISSLLLINVVKADGPYYLDFETDITNELEPRDKLEYKDGYIFIDDDYSSGDLLMSYYSNKGKLNKSIHIGSYYSIKVWDDYIYLIGSIDTNDLVFYKLDSNLNIKKELSFENITIQDDLPDSELPNYIVDIRYALHYNLFVDNGYINFVDYNGNVHPFTKDLEAKEQHQITKKELAIADRLYTILDTVLNNNMDNMSSILSGDVDSKNNIVLGTYTIKESCMTGDMYNLSQEELNNCVSDYMTLYDKDGKEIWKKEMPKNTMVSYLIFAQDHIVAITKKYNVRVSGLKFDNTKDTIVIYDMKGNEIQTITTKYGFAFLRTTTSGFMATQDSCSDYWVLGSSFNTIDTTTNSQIIGQKDPTKDSHGPVAAPNSCSSNHQVYYLALTIETKVLSGKGTIKAINSARPGEPVTFVVTPDEGYELGVVKVTDALGNVVYFNSNTFTMPNANVLIEATFVPKNPKTADIAIAGVATIMVLTTILVVYQYIKLTKPKEIK